jgi:hypothetical protein
VVAIQNEEVINVWKTITIKSGPPDNGVRVIRNLTFFPNLKDLYRELC